MTLGLIIFLGSLGVFSSFMGEGKVSTGLERVGEGFEAIGAFPFTDLEALGGGFKGLLEACDLEALG